MKQPNQRAVTVRFSMRDYLDLVSSAEEQKTTIAEIIRQAWANHHEQQNLMLLLSKLEQQLLLKTFEICAATVGLSDAERTAAVRQVNTALGKEVIR